MNGKKEVIDYRLVCAAAKPSLTARRTWNRPLHRFHHFACNLAATARLFREIDIRSICGQERKKEGQSMGGHCF